MGITTEVPSILTTRLALGELLKQYRLLDSLEFNLFTKNL
jgi:hypothetical protein